MKGPPKKMQKISHGDGSTASAEAKPFRYEDHREFWVCGYADLTKDLVTGFSWFWTQAFNFEWRVDAKLLTKGQELVAATRPLCSNNEEYGIASVVNGCYWMAGFFADMPVFLKHGSVLPKEDEQWLPSKAVMVFYDFNTSCWWVCHPSFGQEGVKTEWLGKSVVHSSDFYDFSAMSWFFPHDAAEPTKAVICMPSHIWWDDWSSAQNHELQETIAKKDEEINQLKAEVQKLQEKVSHSSQEAEGQAPATSSASNAAAGDAQQDEGSEKVKGGWMNRMVALLAAIDGKNWQRVYYLADKFSKHWAITKPLEFHKKALEKWGYDNKYDY
jgi:hypothetical protein